MTKQYNFPDHKNGDTFGGVQFELLVNSEAKDLTGASIVMSINDTTYTTDGGEIVITDASAGKFQFAEQIVSLAAGNYPYEIVITFSDGSIKTYIEGYWRIVD
jgi:hypothetical protein